MWGVDSELASELACLTSLTRLTNLSVTLRISWDGSQRSSQQDSSLLALTQLAFLRLDASRLGYTADTLLLPPQAIPSWTLGAADKCVLLSSAA